jgi:hypothetical protein
MRHRPLERQNAHQRITPIKHDSPNTFHHTPSF